MLRLPLGLFCLALLLGPLGVVPVAADARDDARKQVEFGIEVARLGLWREAIYRWERASEIDPSYADAERNLKLAQELLLTSPQ